MADPATITTSIAKPVASGTATAEVGTETLAKKPGETADDLVEVKAMKPYLGAEDKRNVGMADHDDNKPYQVTRQRAAELRSHGLAEYVSDGDLAREVDDGAKEAGERIRKRFETKR